MYTSYLSIFASTAFFCHLQKNNLDKNENEIWVWKTSSPEHIKNTKAKTQNWMNWWWIAEAAGELFFTARLELAEQSCTQRQVTHLPLNRQIQIQTQIQPQMQKYHQSWSRHYPVNCLLCLHCFHCLHCVLCFHYLHCLNCGLCFTVYTTLTAYTAYTASIAFSAYTSYTA